MKRLLILASVFLTLSFAAASYATAQQTGGAEGESGTFAEFDALFFYNFDLAEADCPEGGFAETCYVHGYDDFFVFRNKFLLIFSQELETVKRWRFTQIEIAGEMTEVFSATYRPRREDDPFTLIYVPESYLFLQR